MNQHIQKLNKDLLSALQSGREVFWGNPSLNFHSMTKSGHQEIVDAEERLARFAPLLKTLFPETVNGIIESPIKRLVNMQRTLEDYYRSPVQGQVILKCDHELPIAGSIKARGGIYEVLKIAETIAIERGWINESDDYSILGSDRFQECYSRYTITVGSTGNLGLSIGIMGATLGFKVTVHMSRDAKLWKKDLLRKKGVKVVEHEKDFSHAVAEGRRLSKSDPKGFFIDDENSKDLFTGYSVAALRLKEQLESEGIKVDGEHPLIVYLPCGVGGGPGGVTYGLKQVYGEHVHCYFAEPVQSPCMLLGLATGKHEGISVRDIGLTNRTEADGLAVASPSALAGRMIEKRLNGVFTTSDETLFKLLAQLYVSESISLEPSALAGMIGPVLPSVQEHLSSLGVGLSHATHLVWATGGNLVPPQIMKEYIETGKSYLE
ncbi:D-serine ammonia-lyase [Bacillus sp. MCCB 382]|uniref:D-serine ammonia-lyase n=1 Tax=Bacillus sp. MCCB 382 TaxID=2860197 RepID=UPI001C56EF94|nr:D-serine ammonia-lyase [Bacillus sp. MCCB 382]